MAHLDPALDTVSVTGIAEPHQSTVAAILRAVGQGSCSAVEAEVVINRIRSHKTALPVVSVEPPHVKSG